VLQLKTIQMKKELTATETYITISALEAHKERFNKYINEEIDEKDKQSAIDYVSKLDSIINKLK